MSTPTPSSTGSAAAWATIVLALYGAMFVVIGVMAAVAPGTMAEALKLAEPVSAQALVELRAVYGGLQLGFGLLYLMAALMPALRPFAYLALIVLFSPLLAARVAGLALDGGFDGYMAMALVFEAASVALGIAGRRLDPAK